MGNSLHSYRVLVFNGHESYICLLAATGHRFEVVPPKALPEKRWNREFLPLPDNVIEINWEQAIAGVCEGGYDLVLCLTLQDVLAVQDWEVPRLFVGLNTIGVDGGLSGMSKQQYLESLRPLFRQVDIAFISEEQRRDWGWDGPAVVGELDPNQHEGWRRVFTDCVDRWQRHGAQRPAVRPLRAAIVVLEQECPSTTQSLVEALGQEVDHYLVERQDGVALGAQLEAIRLDRAWELLAIVGPGARCSTADWQRLLGVLADHPDVGLAVAGEGPAALDGCMVVRGAALEAGGGFDASFRTPAVLDELARCLHRCGWRLAPAPGCTVEKASQQIWEVAAWAAERQAIAALQTGDRCKTEGDLGGAEQAYRRAIQAKGDFVEPILVLGALLAEQRRTGEAVAEIARLVQLDGQSFRAHNQLGLAQYQARDWQGARRSFERAFELAPSQVEPLINLSVLEWEQDHAEQAIDYLERAAQLEPDNREVIVNTGLIQAELGYCESALELFRGYSQAHPADIEVMELVVELLMQTGQSQEACQVAGRILDRQPGHARALSIVERERG